MCEQIYIYMYYTCTCMQIVMHFAYKSRRTTSEYRYVLICTHAFITLVLFFSYLSLLYVGSTYELVSA